MSSSTAGQSPRAMSSHCLATEALSLVCQRECSLRMQLTGGLIEDKDFACLVSVSKHTWQRFGGYGLWRGLDPHRSISGSLLVSSLIFSQKQPEALSSTIVSHIRAGAPVDPFFGRFVSPDDYNVLITQSTATARRYATIPNVAYFANRSTHPDADPDVALHCGVSVLRRAGVIESSSPSELSSAFGARVIMADISLCVHDEASAVELLTVARAYGADLVLQGLSVASAITRNLRNYKDISITTLYDTLSPQAAFVMMGAMAQHFRPQPVPRESVLKQMHDFDKVSLVKREVWTVTAFDDLLSMHFLDPLNVIRAAEQVAIPKAWLLANASKTLYQCAFDDAQIRLQRASTMKAAVRRTWGGGAPFEDVHQMFGSKTLQAVSDIPDIVDLETRSLFSVVESLSAFWAPQDSEMVKSAAHSLVLAAQFSGKQFRFSDVRDAVRKTRIGAFLRRSCSVTVDFASLVCDEDASTMGLAGVCDIQQRIRPRQKAIAGLVSRGVRFGIAEVVGVLRSHALSMIARNKHAFEVASPDEVVRACSAFTAARDKPSRWVLSLIRALAAPRPLGVHGFDAVNEFGAEDVERVCLHALPQHRDAVRKLLLRH